MIHAFQVLYWLLPLTLRVVLTAASGPAIITRTLRNVDTQETPTTVTISVATTPQGISAESTNQMRRPNTPAESQYSSVSVESISSSTTTIPSAGDETTLSLPAGTNSSNTENLQREEALACARQCLNDAQSAPSAFGKAENVMNASTDAVLTLRSFTDTWEIGRAHV